MTKTLILSIIYAVLAMVLVSLDATYNITYTLFGKLVGAGSQQAYGVGMKLKQPGFLLHVVVFAVLIAVPMFLCKK